MEIKLKELEGDIRQVKSKVDKLDKEVSCISTDLNQLKIFDAETEREISHLSVRVEEIYSDVKTLLSRDGEKWQKFIWIVISLAVGWFFGRV